MSQYTAVIENLFIKAYKVHIWDNYKAFWDDNYEEKLNNLKLSTHASLSAKWATQIMQTAQK